MNMPAGGLMYSIVSTKMHTFHEQSMSVSTQFPVNHESKRRALFPNDMLSDFFNLLFCPDPHAL